MVVSGKKKITKSVIVFAIVCSCLLVILTGCGVNPVTHKPYFQFISDPEENILGEMAKQYVEKEFKNDIFNNKEIEEYVAYVGQKLVNISHHPKLQYTFKILNSETLNAFAIPGKQIYLTTGLLSKLEKESQLAVVLGHEVAHIVLRHPVKMIEENIIAEGYPYLMGYLIRKLSHIKNIPNLSYITTQITDSIISGGFPTEYEQQADILTLDYVVKSGYHPYGMIELMEILQRESRGIPASMKNYLKAHPYVSKDIRSVKNNIDKRYKKELDNAILVNDSIEFQRIIRAYFHNNINNMKFEK